MISAYLIHLAIITTIFVILAVSLNISLGYTGLLNLGHIAFYGIGAYASAILTTRYDQHFFVGVLVGGMIAAFFAWFLTVITNRLKGDYFALGTLGFSFVLYAVFLNWSGLTRGPLGIPGIPKPELFGMVMKTNTQFLAFVLIIAVLCCSFLYVVVRSRYGRVLEGVRDNAIGITALGKNIFKLKYQSMMLSAFFAAIAGSLYAHYISYIDPTTFYLNDIIIILTIVIVGGLASFRGSIVSAIIIILLPELLRFVDLPSSVIGPARQIMYAILLLLILHYRPRGLFGKIDLE